MKFSKLKVSQLKRDSNFKIQLPSSYQCVKNQSRFEWPTNETDFLKMGLIFAYSYVQWRNLTFNGDYSLAYYIVRFENRHFGKNVPKLTAMIVVVLLKFVLVSGEPCMGLV